MFSYVNKVKNVYPTIEKLYDFQYANFCFYSKFTDKYVQFFLL